MTTIYTISPSDMAGLALRLALLSTHYRKDMDFTRANLTREAKTLRKWLAAAIPNNNPPPLEVLEALCDDLNTPAAIAEMHKLARGDGKGLFAAMKLLGLIPEHQRDISYDLVSEVKTIPIEEIPLLKWEDGGIGFSVIGGKQ